MYFFVFYKIGSGEKNLNEQLFTILSTALIKIHKDIY